MNCDLVGNRADDLTLTACILAHRLYSLATLAAPSAVPCIAIATLGLDLSDVVFYHAIAAAEDWSQ